MTTMVSISLAQDVAIDPEAQTQDGAWTLGSRALPAPHGASDALRESIASKPQPNVSEHIRLTTFATAEEWNGFLSPNDASKAQFIEQVAKLWPVTITESENAGVTVRTVTPDEVDPAHKDRLFVHMHGGAYVANHGLAGVDEAMIIARRLKIPVVS